MTLDEYKKLTPKEKRLENKRVEQEICMCFDYEGKHFPCRKCAKNSSK